jgi:polysaccharide biosynthesis protein PslH
VRILFVVPYIPSLIRVRPYNLIRALAEAGHSLHLVLLQPPEDRTASTHPLRPFCEAVDVFPISRIQTLLNGLWALPSGWPLQAAYSRHTQAMQHLQQLAASNRFDVMHVEHLRGAVLADGIQNIPVVFDSVDSITHLFEQAQTQAPRLTQRLMATVDLGRTRRFESRMPFRYAHTLVTSPVDRDAIVALAGRDSSQRLTVIPNGVDLDYFQPTTVHESATILFSGKLSYHANIAAALYLGQEIMPRVWQQRPGAKLLFVGKDPSPAIQALTQDARVTVTGYVPDLRPYLARATLAASPLRYGAGVQNKVLEAMASGLPVVATPSVVRGLQTEIGNGLLVGDTPQQLADQILLLLDDPELREQLGATGRGYVEEHHNWATSAQKLTNIYEQVKRERKSPISSL